MITGRAVVYAGPGSALEIKTSAIPPLAEGEALVDISLCTLCGSDLHTYFGRRSTPTPTVLGHEILGRIAALGPGLPVTDFRGKALAIGQRVTWSIAASCGSCFFCDRQLPQKCEHLVKYGHERIRSGYVFSGGLASVCHLKPGTTIVALPENVPDEVACPVNCATATVAGAIRLTGIQPDDVVLVHGGGMLGLTACAMLHARGLRKVILCEPSEARRELSRKFGASHPIHPEPQLLAETVRELTNDRGADAAIELSGSTRSVEQQIASIRIGGRCILVGTTCPTKAVKLDPERVTRSCLTIRGLHNYTPPDLATAVEFLAQHGHAYPFASLVTRMFLLDDVTKAFEFAEESKSLRVGVRP